MARLCGACRRPLTPEHHDEGERTRVIASRGRGRLPVRLQRTWSCRVRLVTTRGKRRVPETPQRQRPELAAYVHEGSLR